MIEVTIKELTESINIFKELLEIKLNGRSAFLLARIIREVDKEYLAIQNIRNNLIEKYCIKDENNIPIIDENGNNTIIKEFVPNFNNELNELLQTTITLNIEPILLKDLEQFNFTTEQMLKLMPFIKE